MFYQVKFLCSHKLWKHLFSVNQMELVQRVKKPRFSQRRADTRLFLTVSIGEGAELTAKEKGLHQHSEEKNAPFLLTS